MWIKGNMQTFNSPLDPLFWLHSSNIDRLWAEWNTLREHKYSTNGLWTGFKFLKIFVNPSQAAYDVLVREQQATITLGYTYDTGRRPVRRSG